MQKTISLIMLFMIPIIIYSQNPCPGIPTVTYAGQTYNTVQIGSQCWLKENLNVGTMIPGKQDQTNNGVIEKYCYNDSTINCDKYGGLYQWNEALQYQNGVPDIRGICPNGWHIPSYADFNKLAIAVDSNGNDLKAIGQDSYATDKSGFSALLGGFTLYGSYGDLYNGAYFWSSDLVYEGSFSGVFPLRLFFNSNEIYLGYNFYSYYGLSVRCINEYEFTSVEDAQYKLPTDFSLQQNFPNPFNPTTTINYSVPKSGIVKIKVYDLLGKEVATLVNENKPTGNYSVQFNAVKLVSGVYFYRMEAGSFSQTKKLLLVK